MQKLGNFYDFTIHRQGTVINYTKDPLDQLLFLSPGLIGPEDRKGPETTSVRSSGEAHPGGRRVHSGNK